MGQPDCAAGSALGSGAAGGFPARGEFSVVQQTVYIEAFLWKQRLMFGAICTFSVCSAASWEISRCWAPSIFNWNKGRQGQLERFPQCTIWAAWTSAGTKLVHHNLHRVVQLQLPLLQERVVLFSVVSSQRCGEKILFWRIIVETGRIKGPIRFKYKLGL